MAAEAPLEIETLVQEWRGMADQYGRGNPDDRAVTALRYCAGQLETYWSQNCSRTVPLLPYSIQRLIAVAMNFDGNTMPDVEALITAAEHVKAGVS